MSASTTGAPRDARASGKPICGVLHTETSGGEHDESGCVLPLSHEGAHEFVSANGDRYHWVTDLACGCEHCMEAQGDYCTIYWEIPHAASTLLTGKPGALPAA